MTFSLFTIGIIVYTIYKKYIFVKTCLTVTEKIFKQYKFYKFEFEAKDFKELFDIRRDQAQEKFTRDYIKNDDTLIEETKSNIFPDDPLFKMIPLNERPEVYYYNSLHLKQLAYSWLIEGEYFNLSPEEFRNAYLLGIDALRVIKAHTGVVPGDTFMIKVCKRIVLKE